MSVIGIDLGTCNSSASILLDGSAIIIPSAEGFNPLGKAFPSNVAITEGGKMLIGEPARRQAAINPDGTAIEFKHKLGRADKIFLRGKAFSAKQLSALLLQKIKADAESYIGATLAKSIVTVPTYFDDIQRSKTIEACNSAGLDVECIVDESLAASLAWSAGCDMGEGLNIAIINLGGSSMEVSITRHTRGEFELLSTNSDTEMGSIDIDRILIDFLTDYAFHLFEVDIKGDKTAIARVGEAAEIAKIALSHNTNTTINLPFLSRVNNRPLHFEADLSRAEFNYLIQPILNRLQSIILRTLNDAMLTGHEIDEVILIGGSTRIPALRERVKNLIGRSRCEVHPMECVAQGAALNSRFRL